LDVFLIKEDFILNWEPIFIINFLYSKITKDIISITTMSVCLFFVVPVCFVFYNQIKSREIRKNRKINENIIINENYEENKNNIILKKKNKKVEKKNYKIHEVNFKYLETGINHTLFRGNFDINEYDFSIKNILGILFILIFISVLATLIEIIHIKNKKIYNNKDDVIMNNNYIKLS
jgi:hypothetical protein